MFGKQKDIVYRRNPEGSSEDKQFAFFSALLLLIVLGREASVVHLGCERLLLFGLLETSEKTTSQSCCLHPLLSLQPEELIFSKLELPF